MHVFGYAATRRLLLERVPPCVCGTDLGVLHAQFANPITQMRSCCCRTRAAWLQRINLNPRAIVGIVEQWTVSNPSNHVKEALFNDVLVDRHKACLPCFDCARIGRELHHVKLSAWFDVTPSKLGYFPGTSP